MSAAIAPVLIGAVLASKYEHHLEVTIACFIVAMFLQIGVNYSNDYSDGIKGTDANRVGPMRLVGSGSASPKSVLIAAILCFLVAAIAGIYVALSSSLWLIAIGALCIALAWFYTGSKHPYGYYGFGEIVVFICFGLVATVGTFYVNTSFVTAQSVLLSFVPGMFSVMILLANNIRDIETDKLSNKKTLPVRIGENNARRLLALCAIVAVVSPLIAGVLEAESESTIGLSLYLFVYSAVISVFIASLIFRLYKAANPVAYIQLLKQTSAANLIVAVLLSVVIAVN